MAIVRTGRVPDGAVGRERSGVTGTPGGALADGDDGGTAAAGAASARQRLAATRSRDELSSARRTRTGQRGTAAAAAVIRTSPEEAGMLDSGCQRPGRTCRSSTSRSPPSAGRRLRRPVTVTVDAGPALVVALSSCTRGVIAACAGHAGARASMASAAIRYP